MSIVTSDAWLGQEPCIKGRATIAQVRGANAPLPPTDALLVSGGDDRIAIDRASGLNKYGCAALPDPTLLSFASATTTAISSAALGAAEALRSRIVEALEADTGPEAYARELARIKTELVDLNELSTMHGLNVVFASSGTDLHLLASFQVFGRRRAPGTVIMVERTETGSGVHAALSGRHFNHSTSLGMHVAEGGCIGGEPLAQTCAVDLRQADGQPRPISEIDDEIEALVVQATRRGRQVMLVIADQSRTGLLAPSPARAIEWSRRYPDQLTVMVDACQFRVGPATLGAYLDQGWLVAITGSKFLGGSAFSGALLVPAACAHFARMPAPGLAAYSLRSDWPATWGTQGLLEDATNFGLILRWESALHTLRSFSALRSEAVSGFMQSFGHAVGERLSTMRCTAPMAAPAFDRSFARGKGRWDEVPSIFPFLLIDPGTRLPLDRDRTMKVHRALSAKASGNTASAINPTEDELAHMRCQFGQPVPMGERGGTPVSALRLCLGATQINQALTHRDGAATIMNRVHLALDKLDWAMGKLTR